MQIYSTDNSILVNKTSDCFYDLKVNPAILGTGGGGGFSYVNFGDTSTISFSGNGTTIAAQAYVKLSSLAGNILTERSDGLYIAASTSYTDAQARLALSGIGAIQYNNTTGTISVSNGGPSSNGIISSTDWNIFNNKPSGAENIGSGASIYRQTIAGLLQFKKIAQGTNITVVDSGDSLTINATGSSSYTDANARAAISGTSPIIYNSATGNISIGIASSSITGALSSGDWTVFNNKVPQNRLINTIAPLSGGGNLSSDLNLSIPLGTGIQDGYISIADWNRFNNKQDSITWQTLSSVDGKITVTGGVGAVKTTASLQINESALNIANMTGTLPISRGGTGQITALAALIALLPSLSGNTGKILGTDGSTVTWVTGGGGGGGENPLTFNAPIIRVGDTISLPVGSSSVDGYLSSSNFNNFANRVNDGNNLGTVGARVFAQKTGTNLDFRRIVAGTNAVVSEGINDITISLNPGTITGGNAVITTVAALAANGASQTALPYYIIDIGQEGFFYYDSTSSATSNGGSVYGSINSGTIIRSASSKTYIRSGYNILDIRWFGGKADYTNSGTTMLGTNNSLALDQMYSIAGSGQECLIPYGNWYFATKPSTLWDHNKEYHLTVKGNTWHNGVDFITAATDSVPYRFHKFKHEGTATGKLGLFNQDAAAYTADPSGTRWASLTGDFINLTDSFRFEADISSVYGFNSAIRIQNGVYPVGGSQENKFKWTWLNTNRYGILLQSNNGSSYCDKNNFFGGRITAQTPIFMDGDVTQGTITSKRGAFSENVFFNVLIEACDTGLIMQAVSRRNRFIWDIEGGAGKGVFGPTKISIISNADGVTGAVIGENQFVGCGVMYQDYIDTSVGANNPGKNMLISGSPIYNTSTAQYIGANTLGGLSTGRMTMISSQVLNSSNYTAIPANIDYINFLSTGFTTDSYQKPWQFAYVRLNGILQSVEYSGTKLNITVPSSTTATYTVPSPLGYIRIAPSDNGLITLNISGSEVAYNSRWFWLELVGTSSVQFFRTDTSVNVGLSGLSGAGTYLVRVLSAGFGATKIGGGTGTAYAFGAIGAGNVNGGTVSGSTITLHAATSSFPGLMSTTTQTFTGDKTFSNNVILSSQAGAGTRMVTVDASGVIGNAAIPSGGGGGGSYTFSTGLSNASSVITNNLVTGIASTNQTVVGSVNSYGTLTLSSTTNATKGQIIAADTIKLRANNSGAASSVPIIFNTSATALSPTAVAGAVQYFSGDLYYTNNSGATSKIITADNNSVLTGKYWQANTIALTYGGTGAITAKGARTNILPAQTGFDPTYALHTDGTDVFWGEDSYDYNFEDGVPTYTLSVGAGTGASSSGMAASNSNSRGRVVITTGSSPSTGLIITVNYSVDAVVTTIPVLYPANQAAAAVASSIYVTATNTGFKINSSISGALTNATQYQWMYHVRKAALGGT